MVDIAAFDDPQCDSHWIQHWVSEQAHCYSNVCILKYELFSENEILGGQGLLWIPFKPQRDEVDMFLASEWSNLELIMTFHIAMWL